MGKNQGKFKKVRKQPLFLGNNLINEPIPDVNGLKHFFYLLLPLVISIFYLSFVTLRFRPFHFLFIIFIFWLKGRCSLPLGLEDKRITNGLLSASTYYNHHLSPWHGRLNHRWSWSARTNNHNQWFQVSFVGVVRATGIGTQGRQDANQWVTKYIVSYSPDSTHFRFYSEGRGTKVRVCLVCHFFVLTRFLSSL